MQQLYLLRLGVFCCFFKENNKNYINWRLHSLLRKHMRTFKLWGRKITAYDLYLLLSDLILVVQHNRLAKVFLFLQNMSLKARSYVKSSQLGWKFRCLRGDLWFSCFCKPAPALLFEVSVILSHALPTSNMDLA